MRKIMKTLDFVYLVEFGRCDGTGQAQRKVVCFTKAAVKKIKPKGYRQTDRERGATFGLVLWQEWQPKKFMQTGDWMRVSILEVANDALEKPFDYKKWDESDWQARKAKADLRTAALKFSF